MRALHLSTSLAALVSFQGAALAQDISPPTGTANGSNRELANLAINRSIANGPNDRMLISTPVPEIQLLATSEKKVASLAWSFNLSPPTSGNDASFTQFSLRVATDIDDEEGDNELFGLRGFAGGTEVKLNLTHFFGRIRDGAENEAELVAGARRTCEGRNQERPAAERTALCDPDADGFRGSLSSFVEQYGSGNDIDDFTRGRFAPAFPFIGVEFGGNQDRYSYLNRAAFSMAKESHFGYTATLFAGAVFTNSLTSITGSFTYSRLYEAQRSVTLCQAINANQEQCLTGADGAPGVTRSAVAAIELRRAFGSVNRGPARFAVAPEFSIDFRNHAYAFDLPIYFAQDSSSKLRGGVRLGYVNRRAVGGGREDEFTAGLFVGVPFNILR